MSAKVQETYILKLLAKNLKYYRLQQNLTQEKLAELSDLHPTYISDIERALRNISLENVYMLAKALNISVSTLLSDND